MSRRFKCFTCHEWVEPEDEFAFNDLRVCEDCFNMLEGKKNRLIIIRQNSEPGPGNAPEDYIYQKVKLDDEFIEKPNKRKASKKKQLPTKNNRLGSARK